jgi:hypothetical protein
MCQRPLLLNFQNIPNLLLFENDFSWLTSFPFAMWHFFGAYPDGFVVFLKRWSGIFWKLCNEVL